MQLNKPLIIIIGLAVILLSVAAWYFSRPIGTIEFALAPQTMTLSMDGKEQQITHGQVIKLKPGKYEADFTSENFQTNTQSIVVEDGKKNRIIIALTPLNDAGKKQLDTSESKKVIEEYNEQQYKELVASLPLSGVNYSISACQSVKKPTSDNKAICITAKTAAGEAAATESLRQLGYNPDELEILIGGENIKRVFVTDTYKIEHSSNTQIEHSTKMALFITPLNVPFVAFNAPRNEQLEGIKSDALAALEAKGYKLDNYDIYYSNIYLSRYNPVMHEDEGDAHYSAPLPAN